MSDLFLTYKFPAAMGIVAYPGLGIYKSIRATFKDKTRLSIAEAHHQEALFFLNGINGQSLDAQDILNTFQKM